MFFLAVFTNNNFRLSQLHTEGKQQDNTLVEYIISESKEGGARPSGAHKQRKAYRQNGTKRQQSYVSLF